MVADTVRGKSSARGLRPLKLARDWRQVLELIKVAFGEALDAEAQRALRSMRLPPLLAPLIGFLDSLSAPGEGTMPGFVWLEGGQIVGAASVRRIYPLSRGWLISNVAVHPEWQGQGIGRALLEASIEYADDHGGNWIVLQVRDKNVIALHLYESLGFEPISEVTRLQKTAVGDSTTVGIPEGFRPARWSDGSALARLARTLTPHDVLWADVLSRDIYNTGPFSRLTSWLRRRRRRWWVQDARRETRKGRDLSAPLTRGGLSAAIGVEVDAYLPWHRLRLLIPPTAQDEQLAAQLVSFGLGRLGEARQVPVVVEHPASDKTTQSALAQAGFTPEYALVHLRLNLS